MKSALEIVAFANISRTQGILALIDVAQKALDEDGICLAAAYLEHAREAYINHLNSLSQDARPRRAVN